MDYIVKKLSEYDNKFKVEIHNELEIYDFIESHDQDAIFKKLDFIFNYIYLHEYVNFKGNLLYKDGKLHVVLSDIQHSDLNIHFRELLSNFNDEYITVS